MKVLVCDDHQLLAEALSSVLRRRGDEVTITSSPDEGVAAALAEQPDVCLMDRTFPAGGDGIDATRRVLAVSPGTRVVMLTGNVDVAGVRAAVDAGARGFLRKDDALHVILEAVDQVAAGALVVDPALLRLPAQPGKVLLSPLTAREQEVLERIVRGESTQAMAQHMDVTYSTARTHTQNLLTKLGVHSQLQAAAFAVQHGLVRQDAPAEQADAAGSGAGT